MESSSLLRRVTRTGMPSRMFPTCSQAGDVDLTQHDYARQGSKIKCPPSGMVKRRALQQHMFSLTAVEHMALLAKQNAVLRTSSMVIGQCSLMITQL